MRDNVESKSSRFFNEQDLEAEKLISDNGDAGQVRPSVPPIWVGFDHYETAVSLTVVDFLNPGDLFFDVGANLGGLSLTGARSVGPFGQVVAFEVSPRIIPQLLVNLQHWHATNVFVIAKAAWSSSGETIDLFFGGAHYADSVVRNEGKSQPDHVAETIALDDVVESLGRAPTLVKFDIEGAEPQALRGFEKTISKSHPTLIVEMDATDQELSDWLRARGYHLFVCDTYAPFSASEGESALRNVLAIHENNEAELRFMKSCESKLATSKSPEDWRDDLEGPYLNLGKVPPGRYRLEFDPTPEALNDNNETELHVICGEPWKALNVHVSNWGHLARSYTAQPFHIYREQEIVMRIKKRRLDEIPRLLDQVRLLRIDGPTGEAAPWELQSSRL